MRVFPLKPGSKEPIRGFKWADLATAEPSKVRELFHEHPDANVGVVLGEPLQDGRIAYCLDVDVKGNAGGMEYAKKLLAQFGLKSLTQIATSRTASGGLHVLFAASPEEFERFPIRNKQVEEACGVDIKTTRGYIVAPPSVLSRCLRSPNKVGSDTTGLDR